MNAKNLNRLLAVMVSAISLQTALLWPIESAAQGSTFTFNNRIPGVGATIAGGGATNPAGTPGPIRLTWPCGTLQEADAVTGPWLDVGTTSPQTMAATSAKRFYQVRR